MAKQAKRRARDEAARATLDARKALQVAHRTGDAREIAWARAHVEACTLAELAAEREAGHA